MVSLIWFPHSYVLPAYFVDVFRFLFGYVYWLYCKVSSFPPKNFLLQLCSIIGKTLFIQCVNTYVFSGAPYFTIINNTVLIFFYHFKRQVKQNIKVPSSPRKNSYMFKFLGMSFLIG